MVSKLISSGKGLLLNKQKNILSATAIMIILVAITKAVGFWKIHLMARFFGTPRELDIFWAASTIPDMLYNIFVVGSLNSALIPTLSARLVTKGKKSLHRLFNWVLNFLILWFIVFGILAVIFARPIAQFMIDIGATQATEPFTVVEIDRMANLMRLMMISPLLLGISSIHSAILNVYDRFVVPTLGPLFYNILIILAMLVLVKGLGLGVYGLAIGVILGSLSQVLVQLPLLKHLRIPYYMRIRWKSKDLWKIIKLSIPRIIGIAGDQVAIVVDRVIGLGLAIGSLSAFNYALTLYLVPIQLFGSTIGRTTNPSLSRDYAKGDMKGFRSTLLDSLQLSFFCSIPIAVILIVLRVPLVRMILGAGEFSWKATLTTGWVLAFLGIGVLGQIVIAILARAFYSMQNTITPVLISLFGSFINVLGALAFTNLFSHYEEVRFLAPFQNGWDWSKFTHYFTTRADGDFAVGGLGLAMSVAVFVWSSLLLYFLNRRVKFMSWKKFWHPLAQKLVLGVVSGFAMYFWYKWLDQLQLPIFDSTRVIGVASILAIASGVGLIVYILLSRALKIKEMVMVAKMFNSALNKLRS